MLEKDDQIGDYILVKFLGKGQFGEVWLAEKKLPFSSRKFRHALKFLSNNEEEINLGVAEAEIDTWIEASGHPNVMPVTDMIVHGKYVIIVSEYAEGGSLNNWLKRHGGKAPTFEKALEISAGILRGIGHLHARNVVHRDLKPDNILLQGDSPRITDFGISRIISENTAATNAGGSPSYMSPEAFLGNKAPQNDIWSAGVILYELLSGRLPFHAENVFELHDAIRSKEPNPLPDGVPPPIRDVVEKALQKERLKRFQSAEEMRLAIEKASDEMRQTASGETIHIPDGIMPVTKRPLSKRWLRFAVGIAVAAILGTAVVVGARFFAWNLTAGAACAVTEIGNKCPDGTIYAGLSPDANVRIFTTLYDAGVTTINNQTFTGSRLELGWSDGDSYCRELSLDGHDDWRLPTIKETGTLYMNLYEIRGFDTDPSENRGWYWSSTPAKLDESALSWKFSDGRNGGRFLFDRLYVRCVRN